MTEVDKIVKLVDDSFAFNQEPTDLKEYIINILVTSGLSKTELQASEYFEENEESILASLIRLSTNKYNKFDYICPFEFFDDYKKIKGFSIPTKKDSEMKLEVRKIAPYVKKMHESLLSINASRFEDLCKKILELLKARDTVRTQISKDEGIDFWGWLTLPKTYISQDDIKLYETDFKCLVIGQAKRYKKSLKIGKSDIREYLGTISALHYDQLSPWQSRFELDNFKLMSPILPLFITTGYVTSGAKDLSQKCGVVIKNGAETSMFLLLEGVGVRKYKSGKIGYVKRDFERWLDA